MMASPLHRLPFREIWCLDFEFHPDDHREGGRPVPVCLVARELRTARTIRQWRGEFGSHPPFPTDDRTLFVGFYASAEWGCFKALGWPMPRRIIDTYAEHVHQLNGWPRRTGKELKGWLSLPNVARHWGAQPALSAAHKNEMQTRIAFDPSPFSAQERREVLDYCADDVMMTASLFCRQLLQFSQDRDWFKTALWRGRYTPAVALMEWHGIPIDTELLSRLDRHWEALMRSLIEETDAEARVFENGQLKLARIDDFATRERISWPRTKTGLPATNEKAFEELHDAYPQLNSLLTLISTRNKLKLHRLQVGPDGRNRTLLGMFGSLTGRNQPSSAKYIFGPARWVRHLIKPGPGRAVALLDYKHEEPRIGAIKSGDAALLLALNTGDVYLALAVAVGLAPAGATKDTHGPERHKAKQTFLGVSYGMSAAGLARRLNIDELERRT